MAYPRPRGDDPLNFEEYDPTPFSGGYDQVALYGRPKSPSSESCYPISDSGPQGGSFGSHYGSENTPYLPGKGSGPKYAVDESRPTYKQQDPPHGSGDDFPSSYGRPNPKPKPKPSSGYDEGVGYGRRKPDPTYQESGQTYGGDYGGGEEDKPVYGRPKPRPTNESSFVDEEEFGTPKPGFGRPKPTYSAEVEEGYGRPTYGSGFGPEEGYGKPPLSEESYGGGRRPSRYEGEDSEFGGGDGDRFGGRKPSKYGSEETDFGGGFGGRRPSGDRPDIGEGNEEGYGGSRPANFQSEEPQYADRPSYGGGFGEYRPPPPADEEYGGYRKNTWEEGEKAHEGHGEKHHHKHHWRPDDE